MQQEGRLTKILEDKDKLDTKILRGTINMVSALKVDNLLFHNDKKMHDEYFGQILNIAQSLYKANNHRRKYLEQEKKYLKKFRKHSILNPNTVDLGTIPVELNSEIDGMLSHIKAALDSYAKSLKPLLGIDLNGWHKVKKESGRGVVKVLENNLSDLLKDRVKDLKEYIESNIQWVSYVVFLRDSAPHHGGIKNISEIIFKQETKEIIPQMITHPDNQIEKVRDYIDRLMNEVAIFMNTIIALSLLARSPFDGITENSDIDWPPYSWI